MTEVHVVYLESKGGAKIKFDGKMRIVLYMICKVAYIIEFRKLKP